MDLHVTKFLTAHTQDLACDCCGRGLLKAVALSDGRTMGMACAARAMGKPVSRVRKAADAVECGRRSALVQAVMVDVDAGGVDYNTADWAAYGFADYSDFHFAMMSQGCTLTDKIRATNYRSSRRNRS